jgi:hypothetical protein
MLVMVMVLMTDVTFAPAAAAATGSDGRPSGVHEACMDRTCCAACLIILYHASAAAAAATGSNGRLEGVHAAWHKQDLQYLCL